MSVNKVHIIGNLGRNPETRYSPSGSAVTNASVACTRSWKSKAGEKQEETEWVRVVFYDKLAEIAGQYLKKGSQVYIEGRMKTRKWQNKQGQDVYTTEVIAEQMQMLGGKSADTGPARKPSQGKPDTDQHNNGGSFQDMDDDLPPF